MTSELRRILLEAIVLAAIGCLVGLSLNYRLVIDAFTGQLAPPRVETAQVIETRLPMPVMLQEIESLVADGALLVDARSPELYREGHLPKAVSLPMVDIEEVLPAFREQVSVETTLVAYCSGYGCPDSFDLGMRLIDEGYQDVRVFEGGLPEWQDAGLPVVEEAP